MPLSATTVAHVNVECPKFNAGDDAARWIMMAKRALRLTFKGQGSDEELVDYAIMHLRGHAATWANDLAPSTWKEFEEAFILKYDVPANLNVLLRQAYTLRLKDGQSVRDLANEVESLRVRMKGFPDEYYAEVFRGALDDPIQKQVPLSVTSYADVLQHALRAEGYVRATGAVEMMTPLPPNPPSLSVAPSQPKEKGKDDFDKLVKGMERLTLALTSQAEKADKRKAAYGPLVCHNCKKEGHFARDCPNPKVQMTATLMEGAEESPCALFLKGQETQAEALHGMQQATKRGRTDGGVTLEEARRMTGQDNPVARRQVRAPERTSQVANLMDQLRTTPAKISLWTYIEESPRAREDLEKALMAVKAAQVRAEAAGVVHDMQVGVALTENENAELVKATVAVNEATAGVASVVGIGPELPVYRVVKCAIKLGPHTIEAIVDTGASGTTMSHVVARRLQLYKFMVESPHSLLTASGERYKPLGMLTRVPIKVGRLTLPVHVTVTDTGDYDLLLGNDWLVPAGAVVDFEEKRLVYRLSPEVQESVPITCGLSFHAHAHYNRLVPTEYSDIQEVVEATTDEEDVQAHPGEGANPWVLSDEEDDNPEVMSVGDDEELEGGDEDEESAIGGGEAAGGEESGSDDGERVRLSAADEELFLHAWNDLITIPLPASGTLPTYTTDWSQIVGCNGPTVPRATSLFLHVPVVDQEDEDMKWWLKSSLEAGSMPTRKDEYGGDWLGRREFKCYSVEPVTKAWVDMGVELTEGQREEVLELCGEYSDVFAMEAQQMGHMLHVKHHIPTGNHPPISRKPHRANLVEQQVIEAEVRELLAQGVIRPSSSPWSFPVVLVPKKDGGHRMCIDYRSLNEVTCSDAYPLPLIDDILDRLNGCRYFSKMDAKSAYHCISVAEEDVQKTAFITPSGLYEYVRMPFGLKNAPATFQRAITNVFRSHGNAVPYLDDILVFSQTWEEHVAHLRQALHLLREAHILLKSSKCFFGTTRTSYLGFIISDEGVAPDPQKVSAVVHWPIPSTAMHVRSFLGLASYYRRFIKGFAEIARPLHALTRKDTPYKWTIECEHAFVKLKERLVTAPILAYPSFHRPFLLQTDFCATGLGAVLAQLDDEGKECVVSYASRSTRGPETHLAPTHGECLALVWGIQHYDPYLRLVPFTVQTDHNALTWLMKSQNLTGKLARWSLILQEYNFTVVHRPGRVHSNVDALSRRPLEEAELGEVIPITFASWGMIGGAANTLRVYTNIHTRLVMGEGQPPAEDEEEEEEITVKEMEAAATENGEGTSTRGGKKKKRKQVESEEPLEKTSRGAINEIFADELAMTALQHGVQAEWDERTKKRVRARIRSYTWSNGKVWYEKEGHLKWVPEPEVRLSWVEYYHGLGHFGVEKTQSLVASSMWWYGMGEDVAVWIKRCDVCILSKGTYPTPAELKAIPVEAPWRRVYMDVAYMPESVFGNKLCLVAVDHFTKWPEVMCARTIKSHDVLAFVEREIIARYSCPAVIHVDAGTHFEGVLPAGLAAWGIYLEKGLREHPQSNGLVERFIQTLKGSLHRMAETDETRWEENLPAVLLGYRASLHSSTRFSPFYLNYGRHPSMTGRQGELLTPRTVGLSEMDDMALIADIGRRVESLREHHEQARANNDMAQARQAEDYKSRRSVNAEEERVPIEVGDWVQIKQAKRHAKKWNNVVHCVLAVESVWVFTLDVNGRSVKRPRRECRVAHKGKGEVPAEMFAKHIAWERKHGKSVVCEELEEEEEEEGDKGMEGMVSVVRASRRHALKAADPQL